MRLRFAVSGRANAEMNEGGGATNDDALTGGETTTEAATGN
jgi:hypothetical protein